LRHDDFAVVGFGVLLADLGHGLIVETDWGGF
jgi:hypothetical protein